MAGDEFFGYDIAALRQIPYEPPNVEVKSLGDVLNVPGKYQKALAEYNEHYYSDRSGVSYDEVPAPENNPNDIEYINAQIMGEQPKTAEYRAQQWKRIGELLSSVQTQLRDQTKVLAEAWESPQAKQIFLSKVGETLAQLDVWHEAATTNSSALQVLAQVQTEVQDEMRALYAEYEKAIAHSATPTQLAELKVGDGGTPIYGSNAGEQEESGPPSSQGNDRMRAQMRETMRSAEDNKANYDKFARELSYRLAERYDPVIQKLAAGRAQKLTLLNAVNHPEAYGLPVDLTPPGGPGGPPGGPGGPPGGPGDAPNAPPKPPPLDKPPFDKDKFDKDQPPFDKDKAPFDKDKLPDALDQSKLPNPGEAPTLPPPVPPVPPVAPLSPPNAPSPLGGPNLSPNTRTALDNALKQLGLPAGANNLQVGPQSFTTSATAQFSATASSLTPNASFPPGTITPPPGGIPGQPKPQGKVLGQRPGVTPPPGAQGRTPGSADQRKPGAATDIPEAFRPPPLSSAPVLDNKKRKIRPGGAKEAPPAQGGTPNATPPVLSNPRRGNGPAKTYSEQRAQRRQDLRRHDATPEIATGAPTGTAPVLTGRFAPANEMPEAPITLRGRAQAPAAKDPHARPEVHADRTARAPQQAEPAATEQSTWEVQTPGGPVVATGAADKQYRPEPPGALGSR